MGAAPSKIDDDKALALCQERKRFVREALDGRCNLATAHFSYVESLRNTGIALRKFTEPGYQTESSMFAMPTMAIPDPVQKAMSQLSNSVPLSNQHVEVTDSFSPSPISSGRFHVNHMKAARMALKTVRQKPPASMTATLESSSPKKPVPTTSGPEESTNYEAPSPPPPGTPPWDYFGLFQPVDDRYTLDDGHGIDHTDDIRRLREEEGIPELEEEEEEEQEQKQEQKQEQEVEQQKEKVPSGDASGDDFGDSDEDDFDKSSKEPLVRIFKNRNLMENHDLVEDLGSDTELHNVGPSNYETDESRTTTPVRVFRNRNVEDFGSYIEPQENGEKENNMSHVGTEESRTRTPVRTPPRAVKQTGANPLVANGKPKEYVRNRQRDFCSCMKEIEELFRKAAESGREVPRMLEADKVHFRPLAADEIAQRSGASTFLMSFFTCCGEEPLQPQASAPGDVKYRTWQRSVSSLSSSSGIPLEETTKDNVDSLNIAGGVYMNSGSHASTLDRLYAWERKLYDEVKASGTIRRDYDFKCKLLRQQESRGENQQKIDKTRATVKDLHSRIRVAIQRIDRISKTIEEIRDKELQPQLEELIEGLIRMWAVMLECHRNQLDIIQSASENRSRKFTNQPELQSQATLTLSHELNLLYTNFTKWISAHNSYLLSIDKWIHKCVSPLQQKSKRKKKQQDSSLRRWGAPPIFATCEDWLKLFTELPTSQVVEAVKDLANMTTHFLPDQEKRGKSLKSSLSLARNGFSGEILRGENGRSNDLQVDWSLNCGSFQSRLAVFLEKLSDFAHKSLDNYQNLKLSIEIAKGDYEKDNQYRR